MVRQDRSRSGRVTPKGEAPGSSKSSVSREPVRLEPSRFARLAPIIMVGGLVAGTLLIIVNYIFLSSPSNTNLLAGLGLILAGIVAATQWQ